MKIEITDCLTVGDIKEALKNIDDDTPIVVTDSNGNVWEIARMIIDNVVGLEVAED